MEEKKQSLTQMITPHQIQDESQLYSIKEAIFVGIENGDVKVDDVFQNWFTFFSEKEFAAEAIAPYWNTYWSWFVQILWRDMGHFPYKQVAQAFIPTLPMAVRQFQRIEATYTTLMAFREKKEAEYIHTVVKKQFLESTMLLNPTWPTEKNMTIGDLADFIKKRERESSVEDYDMLAKLDALLFDGLFLSEPEEIVQSKALQIDSLLMFGSMLTKDTKAEDIVNTYDRLHAQAEESVELDEDSLLLLGFNLLEKVTADKKTQNPNNTPEQQKTETESTEQETTLQNVYKSALQTFGQDLQQMNIEEVIQYLDEQATEQNDERIKDLVQYNETTGTFEWNTQLIDQQS